MLTISMFSYLFKSNKIRDIRGENSIEFNLGDIT